MAADGAIEGEDVIAQPVYGLPIRLVLSHGHYSLGYS